jgi:periodic tryptophan protein 1
MEQGNVAYANEDEWDAEDQEDNEIKPNDALLVVAMTEDEFSHLEVQLFSEEGNLFVHHDITLPDFPLSLAWMDCPPFLAADGSQSTVGNYIAVGTFSPAIEIWNLDVLDPLEPSAVLGGENTELTKSSSKSSKKGKKAGKKTSAFLSGSHEAAVMGLSWNSTYRNYLASGSADMTVKIWDVTTQACIHTFTHHTDKVRCNIINVMCLSWLYNSSRKLVGCPWLRCNSFLYRCKACAGTPPRPGCSPLVPSTRPSH